MDAESAGGAWRGCAPQALHHIVIPAALAVGQLVDIHGVCSL